jgi:hypothetical protein
MVFPWEYALEFGIVSASVFEFPLLFKHLQQDQSKPVDDEGENENCNGSCIELRSVVQSGNPLK